MLCLGGINLLFTVLPLSRYHTRILVFGRKFYSDCNKLWNRAEKRISQSGEQGPVSLCIECSSPTRA